ncbi:peptide deformylase [Ruminococcus sp.]|uniref:peptide deformylase n=1 Tax=Ruminococcus sp. TaxID=41978 RepID=UPI00388FDC7E
MALRNIVKEGDPILLKKCRPVEKFDQRLWDLVDDIVETLADSGGVGLAAPQVGIMRRICVIDVGDGPLEFINPEIIEADGEQEVQEGCLSCPGEFGIIKRPAHVKARFQDRHGEFFELEGDDLLAQAMCHEFDHLDGILFKTKVERMLTEEELKELREED